MTELKKEDVEVLDFILEKISHENSFVTCDDLSKFGTGNPPEFSESDFEKMMFILNEFKVCKCVFSDDASIIYSNPKTSYFLRQGGFKKIYDDSIIENRHTQILREKELNDAKLSKWQVKYFWYIFAFGLVGGIYSTVEIIKSLTTSENAKEKQVTKEELELELIDFGAEEVFEDEDGILIYAPFGSFGTIQKELENRKIEILSSGFERIPQITKKLSEAEVADVEKLIEKIEEDDDVMNVYHTMEE